ncbi:MAG: hypothetical protein MZW92_06350 [Comamonadaceae bacterium]|nr:hypothetical protein [Comamonadaceae bacterium]
MFGKNIIITDNTDWPTSAIVVKPVWIAGRWKIASGSSKDDDLVGAMRPVRHWTDSKIRCHLFTCVVAMTYLRRIELKLAAAGIKRTAADIMQDMRALHYVLSNARGRPEGRIGVLRHPRRPKPKSYRPLASSHRRRWGLTSLIPVNPCRY